MPTLQPVRLVCGCLALCDQDGPVCVLKPCKRYPERTRVQPPREFDAEKYAAQQERRREGRRRSRYPKWCSKKARAKRIDS